MKQLEKLSKKIKSRSASIGIIGLGYVGLPLVIRFAEEGLKTIGFDVDQEKCKKINKGLSYIHHIKNASIKKNLSNINATTNFKKIRDVDVVIICVPTPLNKNREPDMSYITSTLNSIKKFIKKGQAISLESTTYPGTTRELILDVVNEKKFHAGSDFAVIYSPEREDPGNKNFNTKNIPKVVGGITDNCTKIGKDLYETIIDRVVTVSSVEVAEMTKLLENIHRSVNIGLVNEMKVVADKMDIDINEVIDAASTKPFGFVPYYPGPGLVGHCIPIDPFYLTWRAKQFNINTKFIELAGEVNTSMPHFVIDKISLALNSIKKSVKGSKILILGIAYKKNVDDMRESPSLKIIELLTKLGAVLRYSDPLIPKIPKLRNYKFDMKSVKLSKKEIERYDCVVLCTNHDDFNYREIEKYSNLIVDTRGVFRRKKNIIRA